MKLTTPYAVLAGFALVALSLHSHSLVRWSQMHGRRAIGQCRSLFVIRTVILARMFRAFVV